MKFTRLRLSGFKSFVEPTELVIEQGLTGVVGPNGCGKSNLLEALRWAMGESSYKSMRASGMDDVIFSGSASRPQRNMAEVTIVLDNSARAAPVGLNDDEVLEITRRIEREAGSIYRINGRDVRARDVQLLFADASTGARSPALVRQGQINEMINAKPQARRRVLEEAAGITGLYTRRHEAELKLNAAETNLARLDDVIGQLEQQLASLKRQARQAARYKALSGDIRKLEAAQLYRAWADAAQALQDEETGFKEATRTLAERTGHASAAARLREEAAGRVPKLRDDEAVRAAVLQRLEHERDGLDEEARRADARKAELEAQLEQLGADLARESDLIADSDRVLAELKEEEDTLKAAEGSDADTHAQAAKAMQAEADRLAAAQEETDAAAARLSELSARRQTLERSVADHAGRIERIERELNGVAGQRETLAADGVAGTEGETLAAALAGAETAATAAEQAVTDAETSVAEARKAETQARSVRDEARRRADTLETEVRTLSKLLMVSDGDLWPPMLDAVTVAPGYERALGAALGDDLDAAADTAAPIHWATLPALADPPALPGAAEPLSRVVQAPEALARRLSQTGVVSREEGKALQPSLKAGQRLVSAEGDLWRWDGFTAAADAPSAAAQRLAERNRLADLTKEAESARADADTAEDALTAARSALEAEQTRERETREAARAARAAVDARRADLSAHERRESERTAKLSALDEAARRLGADLEEARAAHEAARTEYDGMEPLDTLKAEVDRLRGVLAGHRAAYAEARAHHDGLEREARMRRDRLSRIEEERRSWLDRTGRASQQVASLEERRTAIRTQLTGLEKTPQEIEARRSKLMSALRDAEAQRKEASDALADAENTLREAEHAAREAEAALSDAREEQARREARRDAARERLQDTAARIDEVLEATPEEALAAAGAETADELPAPDRIASDLARLKADRERLGSVNLRADEEAEAVDSQLGELTAERDDVVQAIQRLRQGIASLNREGRQRLLEAFETVNANFAELFATLFGGGHAELRLVESDDPLEAGLEIMANPPGKRPSTLTLLSGGEQTLTAIALIFAVFLTNPSPICVLDEVDAPLDDSNVERFCNLLNAMLERADTRFLIITHHPLTMARMNRLFGVTMMERGVSQLVSVDLETAEGLREAS
ncbi:chromosome segregation protein SMC [Kaustia mangrovi]|uniref:Chromosome partition protein Smc n=1 Tax=Kaustia mangrovi TaxID=2593653 RepID=A0A7S8C2E8_9HYPH|nr:chromosome segregation protein SMC [Kaustia mangrovi]QPC42114.1 chromosome segregation protein SMC [Kaustia mangrovi]